MEDKKCIQLTGGPLVPDVPLSPDFPPWPWTERVMFHSSDMLVWWKMQSNNNAWSDWVSHTKKNMPLLFMSLLDHLWILSVLVVPLAQDLPKMIITVWIELHWLCLGTLTQYLYINSIFLSFTFERHEYLQEALGHQLHLSFHQNLFDPGKHFQLFNVQNIT